MEKARKIYTDYNEIHPLYPERERTMDENETFETEEETSLGTQIAQAFLVSAASAAGMWVGMIAVGVVVEKLQKRADRKKLTPITFIHEAEPQED